MKATTLAFELTEPQAALLRKCIEMVMDETKSPVIKENLASLFQRLDALDFDDAKAA